jgi:hypothetical protein
MVEEKQKKYEELMTEYTYLGKDLRQVSSSLLEATEKQKGLQEAMMSARETRKKPNEYMERRRLLGNG